MIAGAADILKLASALFVTLLLSATTSAQEKGIAKQVADALIIAQQQVPDRQLIRGRVEARRGITVYGFYFWLRGKMIEIEINEVGKIVKNTNEDSDEVIALATRAGGEGVDPSQY